ncbi:MAG: aminoglycoside phosphotransferase family protein [Sedimentisphaerales bacterium]|nr:aminoglycoside phosphotransferase family protein [Sedimentisphaerales bacterium]
MVYDIRSIAAQFHLDGQLVHIEPLGSGHINDTYSLIYKIDSSTCRYVLQRINHHVFADPPAMMDNIRRVTEHIRGKLAAQGSELAQRQLILIETRDGAGFFRDEEGNYWRIYNRIENAVTYDVLESFSLAQETARMFGWFQRILTDLPGDPLHETIVDFHTTPKRLAAFEKSLRADAYNRACEAKEEIDFVHTHAAICDVLLNCVNSGTIPWRVTHNDTKINNVMIDEKTHRGVCIIDLDTVMPGLSLYDFGDMVRTATSPADEDERDLSKVTMRIEMFEALVNGFAQETYTFLTPTEKKYLAFSGKLITFEQMIRFLTDYLSGDVYYKIHRPGHNQDRCRTQMKLMQSIIAQEERMNALVDSTYNALS